MIFPASIAARLLIVATFSVCMMLIGAGAHKVLTDRKIAQMERDFATKYAASEKARADAEQEARQREREFRDSVKEKVSEYHAAIKQRDRVLRDLSAAGNGLRERIAELTGDSRTAAATDPANRHLYARVETLGLLLAEADGLAEASSREADELRDELSLCREYITIVFPVKD